MFHQWYEVPLGISNLLSLPTAELVTITNKEAVSFIPSEEMRSIKEFNSDKLYKFNGTPNIKPRTTRCVINRVISRKRKISND